MAEQRSDKMNCQSKFGGGWITASQFLAELMCERFALSQGDHLSDKFWNDKYWAKKFVQQASQAAAFLKVYDLETILKALAHPDLKRVYSFGNKSAIEPILKRTAKKFVPKVTEKVEVSVPTRTDEKPRTPFNPKPNVLKKLRELDG